MRKITRRLLDIRLPRNRSAFLWGPRKVGKTYWLHHGFCKGTEWVIDLLQTDVFAECAARPALLRERWDHRLTIIDEVRVKRPIVVTLERTPRKVEGGIEVLPWMDFLQRLWAGEIV